jgi:hypothetical protein
MARSKDDPLLRRLFDGPDGPDGNERAGEGGDDARAALRREVLAIVDGAAGDAAVEPLDDGLVSAYLDDALAPDERAGLEARLAASPMLREQVAAAALAREAGLESGLALPADFAADYDAVPGPAKAPNAAARVPSRGLIGRLFGGPSPARRWLAATVPVLAVVVVAVVVGRQWQTERAPLQSNEGPGAAGSKLTANALKKRQRGAESEAFRAKRDVQPKRLEAAKPKPEPRPRVAEQPGRAGAKDTKPAISSTGKVAVLTTTVVPLSSELRDAVVILGRRQLGPQAARPAEKEAKTHSFAPAAPATGSSADEKAREARREKSVGGMLAQRAAPATPHYIDVINRAIAPDCTKDPASCCGSHRVDRNLLDRLLASQPPLHSVKVLHLQSRTCYLTLP